MQNKNLILTVAITLLISYTSKSQERYPIPKDFPVEKEFYMKFFRMMSFVHNKMVESDSVNNEMELERTADIWNTVDFLHKLLMGSYNEQNWRRLEVEGGKLKPKLEPLLVEICEIDLQSEDPTKEEAILMKETCGENRIKAADVMSIYPNPSNGVFNIKSISGLADDNIIIYLRSTEGKVVWRKKFKGEDRIDTELDFTGKDPGTYLLEFQIPDLGSFVDKVVIN